MQLFLYTIGSWLTFLVVDFLFLLFSSLKDLSTLNINSTPDAFTILFIIICYTSIGLFIGVGLKIFELLGKIFLIAKKTKWQYLAITLSFGLNCFMNIVLLYKNHIWAIPFSSTTYSKFYFLFVIMIVCVTLAIKFSYTLQKSPVITLISVCVAGELFWSIIREGLFPGGSLKDSFAGGNRLIVILASFLISSLIFTSIYFYLHRLFVKSKGRGLNFLFCVLMGTILYTSTSAMSFAGQSTATPRRPNIVLVILDTVRADHMSCYGYLKKTTPNIDAFVEQAVKYNHAYAAASWTLPSIASIMTGMYPIGHGADRLKDPEHLSVPIKGLDNNHTPLAELLKKEDYTTAGVIANIFLKNSFGLHQGFDYYDENIASAVTVMQTCVALSFLDIFFPINDFLTSKGHNDKRIGDQVNASAIEWLNRHDNTKPFFLLAHYFDAHHPYSPKKLGMGSVPYSIRNRYARCANYIDVEKQITDSVMNGHKKLLPDEREYLIENYDNQIVSVDIKIGQLFSRLIEMNLYDESLIIIVADHGEAFGEHNLMLHGVCLYEDNLHVPLIIKYPFADQKKGTVDYPVSLTGLVPTVLSYLSISIPDFVQGVPFSDQKNQVILANNIMGTSSPWLLPEPFKADTFSFLQDGHKLIKFNNGHDQLYYLNNDPYETTNVIAQESSTGAGLRKDVAKYIEKYTDRRIFKNAPQDIDKTTLDNLRNLGYIK